MRPYSFRLRNRQNIVLDHNPLIAVRYLNTRHCAHHALWRRSSRTERTSDPELGLRSPLRGLPALTPNPSAASAGEGAAALRSRYALRANHTAHPLPPDGGRGGERVRIHQRIAKPSTTSALIRSVHPCIAQAGDCCGGSAPSYNIAFSLATTPDDTAFSSCASCRACCHCAPRSRPSGSHTCTRAICPNPCLDT